jgi:hypothetical protein
MLYWQQFSSLSGLMLKKYITYLLVIIGFSALLLTAIWQQWLPEQLKADKVGHFFSFLLLAWLCHNLVKLELKVTLLCLGCYAALTEIGQYYLGFRNGEFSDFIANISGVCCFYLCLKIYQKLQGHHRATPQ